MANSPTSYPTVASQRSYNRGFSIAAGVYATGSGTPENSLTTDVTSYSPLYPLLFVYLSSITPSSPDPYISPLSLRIDKKYALIKERMAPCEQQIAQLTQRMMNLKKWCPTS